MPRLDVRIIAARNLPDPQLLGKPDPYVKLALEHQQHKTSVCENQINPKWDEVFKFQIADENSSQLKLELWNSNMMKDDYLGQYVLSLSGLQRGVVRDEWLLLQQCKTNSEIHVKILAIDFGILPPAGTPTFTDTNGAPAAGYAPAPAVAPVPVAPAPAPQYAPQQQPQYAPQQPQQPQYAPQQQPQYARPPQQPQYAPQQPQYVPPPPQQPQYAAPQGYPPQPYGAGPAPGMMPPQHHHHHHHQQMAPGYPQAQGYPQQGPGYQARPGYPQGPGFQAQPGYPSYGY